MYTINTKTISSKWYCFGTIKGYDHSFDADTMEGAQGFMKDLLDRIEVPLSQTQWTEPVIYPVDNAPVKKDYYVGSRPIKIDNNPHA